MLCEECGKREARYYERTEINGRPVETRYLCEVCRRKLQPATIGDFFNALTGGAGEVPRARARRCSACGFTYEEFEGNGGYLGCENCYREFADLLRPIILKTQKGARHAGKIPNPSPEDKNAAEYGRLEAELRRALAEENYEACQRLKEKMERLK